MYDPEKAHYFVVTGIVVKDGKFLITKRSNSEKNYPGKNIAIVAHKAPQLALDVILKKKTWKQAFKEDWRKKKAWQPGWEYVIND